MDAILDEVTRRLVEAAHRDRIILFGSYARGDFDKDSDLDLLVILPAVDSRFTEMVRLRSVLRGIPMPIDIVKPFLELTGRSQRGGGDNDGGPNDTPPEVPRRSYVTRTASVQVDRDQA